MAFPAILCAKALEELPGFVLQAPAGPSEGHFWAGSAPQGGCAHPAPRALGLEAECGAPSVGLPGEAWQGWLIQFHGSTRQVHCAGSLGRVPRPAQPWGDAKCWGGWDPPLCPPSSGTGGLHQLRCCAQAHCPGPAWVWVRWPKELLYCLF